MSSEKRAARFWAKVKRLGRGHCWEWVGYKRKSGHGLTSYNRKVMHAHKLAWLLIRGAIPDGACVLHKCHNPPCCNPEHMYIGNRTDNMRDRFAKATRYRLKGVTLSKTPKGVVRTGILPNVE